MTLLHPIHNWHDAAITIAVILALWLCRVVLTLAKRITYVSFPKREIRFK